MERKITEELKAWKDRPGHKPVILTGCRQIGKTYSALEFARKEYDSHVYINFEINPEKKALFDGSLDADSIISRIQLSEKIEMVPGRTVVVLDEIQDCNNAYSALKPLSFSDKVDVIALGSFLGINLDDDDERISPMGFAEIMRMHPMDFEEYLWAMGVRKELVREVARCIMERESIPEYFNKVLSDHYRRFIVVGGMPKVVSVYAETKDYVQVHRELDSILEILRKDAGRYSRKPGRSKINACLESIPHQLSRENKRFLYGDVEKKKGVGKKTYGNSLNWLENAGSVIRCRNLTEPVMPLSERAIDDNFKTYMADTGVLIHMMEDLDPSSIVLGDPYVNHGAIMENAVLSDLIKKGYTPYYYSKKDSTLEIDFVIGVAGKVWLIEVKSGQNKRAKSLRTMMSQRVGNRAGIKVMNGNIMIEENGIVHLPLYAMSLIDEKDVGNIPPAEDAEIVNRMFDEYMGTGPSGNP